MSTMDIVKSVLPWIGTALGGPLGGKAAELVGSALGLDDKSVDSVKNVLSGMSGEQLSALKITELNVELEMKRLGFDNVFKLAELETRNLEAVNKSIQAEAAAEHWPSYSWRPYNGFLFGTTIFGCYFVLPLLKYPVPVVPLEVWATWGGILGIASYFRGKAAADPNIPPVIQIPAKHGIIAKLTGSGSDK